MSPAAVARAADAYESARTNLATPLEAMEHALHAYRQDAATRARYGIPGAAVALIEAVLRSRGVSLAQARRPGKTVPSVLAARDEAIHVARAVCGEEDLSYSALGRFFGDRDHSVFVVGARRFEARLAVDDVLRARINRLVCDSAQKAAA